MRQALKSQTGVSTGDWVLYGLIVIVMLLGGYAIFRSIDVQHQVAVSFVGWYEDKPGYDKALADQKADNKPVLLYIYAPWCPHCKRFSAEVLADKTIQQFIQAYPHVRVAPDHGKQEQQIMADFGAQGYPAFYVIMPNGKRTQVETFIEGEHPRQKTPQEFMKSVLQATGGA
jgi:thiol:disulfide interchange protein